MWLRTLGLSLVVGLVAGCAGERTVGPEERAAIESLLGEYQTAMAAAYAERDADRILGLATERERHRLALSIEELAAEGRQLRPTPRSLAIEAIDTAGHTAVTVNTLEVWDLRVVTIGGEQLVSESLAQENRLTYSLVREEGRWLVLSRLLRTSSEAS